ncbi:NAD binding 4, Epimerase, Sterile and/or 3Beta HSD domain containing protein [Asbolus verrucosus]|uniref:Fatty acyl-CoA reductase n=1 Tax=Asbolus verrucosus TaxID=1661398 RepID=A0A482VGK2_ASBVE|nr:NAD binding 4, Epimerase, Sterile and/or 3Beta HSD domain containing protein [Asbolus verrucosus]
MEEKDRIVETFRGRTVFITGGTGFLGKLLIEKLLRCTEVKKIYMLIRGKKGKAAQERLNDIFANAVFDLLRAQNPASLQKCRVIPGDISREGLAVSSEHRLLLQKEIDFVYHLGASTRFDDSVKTAVKFNTRSTKLLLDLAHGCEKLQIFVHVSTAYAFPKEELLHEKSYKAPTDPHRILAAIDSSTDEECETLMEDSPNTYTFSKALAEELVTEQMEVLPAIIVRPSVVCPTWNEPLPGWCNNLQGPMGLFVGAGKGIIRSMYMKGDSHADFIPADLVVTGLLIASWNYLNNSKNLYQIQRRIQKGSELFEYYTTKNWNFSNSKTAEVAEKMNAKEREIYKIAGEGFDLKEYLRTCMICSRRNILKEPDSTLPAARRHMTM